MLDFSDHTITKSEFQIASELHFAGIVVTPEGVRPYPKRTDALTNFPRPKTHTDIRSFFGLANQFAFFTPNFAHSTACLRQLTGKGTPFVWLSKHQEEFDVIKNILTSKMVMCHFDNKRHSYLITDAPRQHKMGFAMGHMDKFPSGQDCFKIVTCASRSLAAAQKNYSTTKLECLAIVWAIQKCSYYLLG